MQLDVDVTLAQRLQVLLELRLHDRVGVERILLVLGGEDHRVLGRLRLGRFVLRGPCHVGGGPEEAPAGGQDGGGEAVALADFEEAAALDRLHGIAEVSCSHGCLLQGGG